MIGKFLECEEQVFPISIYELDQDAVFVYISFPEKGDYNKFIK
jgi:hypothetical protein